MRLPLHHYGACVAPPRTGIAREAPASRVRYSYDPPHLLIDARTRNGPLLRLGPLEHGLRVQRWVHAFETDHRDFDPLARDVGDEEPSVRALDAFWRSIPCEYTQLVERDAHLTLTMLRCMHASPRFLQLATNHRTLAWLVAATVAHRPIGSADLHELLGRRRGELLGRALGSCQPASTTALRVLERVEVSRYDSFALNALRTALRSRSVVDALRHQRHVPLEQLEMFNVMPALAAKTWLGDLLGMPRQEQRGEARRILRVERDAASVVRVLDLSREEATLTRRARTIRDVEAIHERLLRRLSTHDAPHDQRTSRLAPPPLFGSPTIVAIRTTDELYEEGAVMHHCVAAYVHEARLGTQAIYRVLAPQRATLRISVRTCPRIQELKLACNAAPHPSTWAAVHAWFRTARSNAHAAVPMDTTSGRTQR